MAGKVILGVIFFVGLVYILTPGVPNISYFPTLPDNAIRSTESGDTYQIPNVEAFFSDDRRAFATKFYKNRFDTLKLFGISIPSLRINRPPEEAFQYIRDQQFSNYLEEYTYPLKESLFVNGIEMFDDQGNLRKIPTSTLVDGRYYQSKVTLRLYPTKFYNRLIAYLGIWLSGIGLYILAMRIKVEKV